MVVVAGAVRTLYKDSVVKWALWVTMACQVRKCVGGAYFPMPCIFKFNLMDVNEHSYAI